MSLNDSLFFGAIEAGGTKFLCGIGDSNGKIRDRCRIPTGMPMETLAQVQDYFGAALREYRLQGIGVASFGPLDLDPNSKGYGLITSTPKPGWRDFDLKGELERRLGLPVALDTDVNAAALAEHRWGAGRAVENLVYLTIGTGIGGGALVHGRLVHGLLHPEMGHIRLRGLGRADEFAGVCSYHQHCWEGLASGPAIEARWERPAKALPLDHPAWDTEALYLAQGIAIIVLILSPQKIVMGGGVMEQKHLFPLVRIYLQEQLNGYIQRPEVLEQIDSYIVPAALSPDSGLLGALVLAIDHARG